MTPKKQEYVFTRSVYDLPTNPQELISFLSTALYSIPEEYRASAKFDFDTYINYDSPYAELYLTYWREESPDERYARLWAENRSKEREIQARRELYEQLRKEFGDCECEKS